MCKILTLLCFVLFGAAVYGQKLGQVNLQHGGSLNFFSIQTDQNVLIRISSDGKVLEWGTEALSDRGNYYAAQLQPFMGRVEYYSQESDSAFRGKIKSIGSCYITYYGAYDEVAKRGKLKSMGQLNMDYYGTYDEKSLQGKLKQLGNLSIDYYRQYENEAIRGKLKAIGSTAITYYTTFDDRFNAGKLKTVGATSYTWYSEYDRARGALKSNNYRQNISGILFILR
jgi:hypothetical protein